MPARPKPTALKVLLGNPGGRALNSREPVVRSAVPRAPEYLSDRARKEWRVLTKELGDTRMLSHIDCAALGAYCEAVARMEEATVALREIEARLAAPGMPAEEMGRLQWQVNILSGKRRQAAAEVLRFGVEFGLTPSSRSKIRVPDPQGEFSFAESEDPMSEVRRLAHGA